MPRIRSIALTSTIIAALAAAPLAVADDAAKAPAPAPAPVPAPKDAPKDAKAPPNPLPADPYVGEFESNGIAVTVKAAAEGYEGEIRRNGKAFPFKAAKKDGQVAGAFKFENLSYDFTLTLDGKNLKITTDSETFPLKRKEIDKPAVVPPKNPEPDKGLIVPVPDPVPTLPPIRPKPGVPVAAPPPKAIDYAKLGTAQMRQSPWTRFEPGSFAIYEEGYATSQILSDTVRSKVVFQGIAAGKLALQLHRWETDKWLPPTAATAPSDEAVRIDEFGYTRSVAGSETIVVDKRSLQCRRTTYAGEADSDGGGKIAVKAEFWTSDQVDKPPLFLDLPQKRLLVDPDVVKANVVMEYKSVKVNMTLQVDALDRQGEVGNRDVKYAVVTGKTTITSELSKLERTHDYWISHQVPGGLLRSIDTEVRGRETLRNVRTMVDFLAADPAEKTPGAK